MSVTTISRIGRAAAAITVASVATLAGTGANGTAHAAEPGPLCGLLALCPPPGGQAPAADQTAVTVDLIDVGATLGGVIDTVAGTATTPVLEALVDDVETTADAVLDDVTDVVDGVLDTAGIGEVVTLEADVPVDLGEGLVIAPRATAHVDLGPATGGLVDVDVPLSICGVDVVVAATHSANCGAATAPAPTAASPLLGSLVVPTELCGVQVVVGGRDDVACGSAGLTVAPTLATPLATAGIGATTCGLGLAVLGSATSTCAPATGDGSNGTETDTDDATDTDVDDPDAGGATPDTSVPTAPSGLTGGDTPRQTDPSDETGTVPTTDGSEPGATTGGGSEDPGRPMGLLPLTGLSIGGLVLAAFGLVGTGLVVRRIRAVA